MQKTSHSLHELLPLKILILLVLVTSIADADTEYTRKKCELDGGGHVVAPMVLNVDASPSPIAPIPQCAPEVLYSWKTTKELNGYLSEMNLTGRFLPFKDTLWLWRTPIGSFGYGDYVIRIKLKPHVKFYWNQSWDKTGGCKYLTPAERKNTVIFGYYGGKNYNEYTICSDQVVESWSYGTPEIKTEMKNELQWIQDHSGDLRSYDRMYKTYSRRDRDYDPNAFFKFALDGKDWSEEALQEKFQNIESLLEQTPLGQIYYAPGVPHDRTAAYTVQFPDYFNITNLKAARTEATPKSSANSSTGEILVNSKDWFNSVIIVSRTAGKTCLFEYGSSMKEAGSLSRDKKGYLTLHSGSAYSGWGKVWLSRASMPFHGEGAHLKIQGIFGGPKTTISRLKIDRDSIQNIIENSYEGGASIREICRELIGN